MIPAIEKLYSKDILDICAERYGFDPSTTKAHEGFESFVYEYEQGNKSYIIKITHSIRRTKEYLLGEVYFLNHLIEQGINTLKIVKSINNEYVEKIIDEKNSDPDKGYFLALVYEKLPGADGEDDDFPEWNEMLFEQWGQLMGKMHKANKSYQLVDNKYSRQQWFEEDLFNLEKYIPKDQKEIIEKGNRLIDEIKLLPKDEDSFGMVHGDLHEGNLVYNHGSEIGVIDFDDCEYGYFIADISIAVWGASYFLMEKRNDNSKVYLKKLSDFLSSFFKGYNRENSIDKYWIEKLDKFLKLRELLNYSLIHQTGSYQKVEWQQYIKDFKKDFLSDRPFLKLDVMELNL